MKSKKLTKKNFTKEGIIKLINRDAKEVNSLSDYQIRSLWSFFKFLITDDDGKMAFATGSDTIIFKYKNILEKKYNIKIIEFKKLIGG